MTTLPEQLRAEVAQRIVTGRPWPASSLMIEASDATPERPRVYVASKSELHAYWRTWRATGLTDGFDIISTWIDEGDEGATADWSDLWVRCITEAASADVVVALHRPADQWKGAFVEIGAALAAGKRVHVVGAPPGSWTAHPNVYRFGSVDDAFAAVAS